MERPRSLVKQSKPPNKFMNYMALKSSIIKETIDEQVWRNAMMEDNVWDIVPQPRGKPIPGGSSRSSSLRGKVDVCSIR